LHFAAPTPAPTAAYGSTTSGLNELLNGRI
jgi:hypothetical protein